MVKMKLNGRLVTEIEIDGIDTRDYPGFTDAYIVSACYEDSGKELTSKELEQLQDENGEAVHIMVMDKVC